MYPEASRGLALAPTSSWLEVERLPHERYGLGKRRMAETERSFDDARFAGLEFTQVSREKTDDRAR